jgi:hypothetical protein
MDAIEGEDDHHQEIRYEERDVEGVPTIDIAEGVIRVVRLPVVPKAALRVQEQGKRIEMGVQKGLRMGRCASRVYAMFDWWIRLAGK